MCECDWSAAVHEVGHVVLAFSMRQRIIEVWVRGGDGQVTHPPTLVRHPYFGRKVESLRRSLLITVAGFLAEDLQAEQNAFDRWATRRDHDLLRALAQQEGRPYEPHPYRLSCRVRTPLEPS